MKNLENDLFPACAGVIPLEQLYDLMLETFPRVCGGDPTIRFMRKLYSTFSPRVRG